MRVEVEQLLRRELVKYSNHFEVGGYERDAVDAVEFAKKAIYRAMPQKPIKGRNEAASVDVYFCERCMAVVLPRHKYCSRCGQRIKWKGEEL